MTTVITFGTFDLFHYGHLRILERASQLGDELHVGISTDELNFSKKGKYPVYTELHRLEIVKAIQYVDGAFYEHSLEAKRQYMEQLDGDILVMGEDWEGEFDYLSDICKVVYLPRTSNISTTETIQNISK